MYSKRTIDEVKRSVDIVDFIGRYVNLEKSGSYFRGLCPFHSDNDPSFYVHPNRGFFHCFGCGESGDVIAFLQRIEDVSFSDSVRRLADIAGVVIESESRQQSGYERYVTLLECAVDYYMRMIDQAAEAGPVNYLTKARGISRETIRYFKIGYSPEKGAGLRPVLSSRGFSNDEIERAGLFSGKGSASRERFAGRLIFPIDNESGRTVAIGARILEEKEGPKYLNSPETKYFRKSRTLYSFSRSKTAAVELDFMVVVEGYFDVLALHEAGVHNVVGLLGTALTSSHIRMISKVTENLILFLDSDPAGLKATRRSIEIAESSGMQVAVISTTTKDPADMLVNRGKKALREVLEEGTPAPVFLVELLKRNIDLTTPEGKQKLLELARPLMESYRAGGRIGSFQLMVSTLSDLIDVDQELIANTLKNPERIRVALRAKRSSLKLVEKELMMVYLKYPDLRSRLMKILDLFESSEEFSKLTDLMRNGAELEEIIRACDASTGEEVMNLADVPVDQLVASQIVEQIEERIDKKIISEQIRMINRKLQAKIDVDTKNALMIRSIELHRLLKKVRKDGERIGKEQV